MTKIRFIGDIHGDMLPYFRKIEDAEESGISKTVQIGDFGVGFGKYSSVERIDRYLEPFNVVVSNRFIRGNHDNPEECKKSKNWIPDGTFEDGIFYMGGADSIDKEWRTMGVDWWPDEELSVPELEECIEKYAEAKPRILVTHDCSEHFARNAMIPLVSGVSNRSRTRMAIDVMYARHVPSIHIFGHWHHHVDYLDTHNNVRMICLGIHEHIDLEI